MSFGRAAFPFGRLVAVAFGLTAAGASAQPPDDRSPLPPAEPARKPTAAQYRIPNRDRAIFHGVPDRHGVRAGGIADGQPLASEKEAPDEAAAWAEVVLTAHGHPAAELEKHAARDLTVDDLSYPARELFRLDLVRFDGTLTTARRVRATAAVAAGGVGELFEGRLVPAGEPPTNPVAVVFTDWPAGLPAPPPVPPGQPAGPAAEVNRPVAFAGYSFKLLDPGAGGRTLPLLVGRSVTPTAAVPPAIRLDDGLRVFKLIRDDAPMARTADRWEEAAAWGRVVRHARQFAAADLEAAARRDVGFADLLGPARGDYKLDLVHVEGRLLRLKQVEPPRRLAEAGVPVCYEAWVVPKGQTRGFPVCVIVSELPPGLAPTPVGTLENRWVTAAGYSFKLLQYESEERDAKNPAKNVWKRAPLLIGRALTVAPEPSAADGPGVWVTWFVPALVGGLLSLVGVGLVIGWWFRRGDRAAREAVAAARRDRPLGLE